MHWVDIIQVVSYHSLSRSTALQGHKLVRYFGQNKEMKTLSFNIITFFANRHKPYFMTNVYVIVIISLFGLFNG